MIEIKDLIKNYGSFRVLDKVSFSIKKGDIVGLLGPNGAGKTTLIRILTGFIPLTYGKVNVNNLDIMDNSMEIKKIIGYLPENCPLYMEMTVKDFLFSMAELKGLKSKVIKERFSYVVEAVKITDRINQIIGTLSKGYKQRVGLAQSLIHDPKLLILDEPTVGLDPSQIIEIRDLIQTLKKDRTIILSSHILSEVSQTCERIIIISNGKIVAEGTEEELINKLSNESKIFVQVKDGANKVVEIIQSISGVKNVHFMKNGLIEIQIDTNKDLRASIAQSIVNKGFDLLEMRMKIMTLEEVFVKMTQEVSVI